MTLLTQWLVILVIVAFVVTGNLLLKLGAEKIDLADLAAIPTNGLLVAGLAAFAMAAAGYILLLRYVPLHVAQAFMALQFAATVTAAWAILGESISGLRLLGLVVILMGVLIVSQTQ